MADVNPGLEGVLAAETTISLVDGSAGRLLYRGYEIGDLAAHGTFDSVTALLLDGEWPAAPASLPPAALDEPVLAALRGLPPEAAPLDALRSGVSAWGAARGLDRPPTPDEARELIALAPAIVGGFARLRAGDDPVDPAGAAGLGVAGRLLHAITGEAPEASRERALDAYFVCCAEHGLNASTFTARVVTSTRVRPGKRGVRCHRRAEGAAAWRRTLGRARPAHPDRERRARRAMDPRGARPR